MPSSSGSLGSLSAVSAGQAMSASGSLPTSRISLSLFRLSVSGSTVPEISVSCSSVSICPLFVLPSEMAIMTSPSLLTSCTFVSLFWLSVSTLRVPGFTLHKTLMPSSSAVFRSPFEFIGTTSSSTSTLAI
ncbi:hypothetical protein FOTG_18274 [Fusarium oxysporum f. sp. vasinfectum 25433]|uniref:Uncharacterized protein n=1 Tax=Fusarium oxysporum f. sp. vasinfectum 25433 TaxID=1089449 RepID=X0KWX0_FUSOX|nr:hypothetical protein FOTG_18274 [Fusarium oxysporum f. sp. vasinfectum 25433]